MEADLETNAGQEAPEAKATEQVVNDGKESRDKTSQRTIQVERGKEASNGALEALDSAEASEQPPSRTNRGLRSLVPVPRLHLHFRGPPVHPSRLVSEHNVHAWDAPLSRDFPG